MMTIGSITGIGSRQAGQSGMNMQIDPVSKNIQNQIAQAQKRQQEISSNEEMTLEEKMKKKQEIQQEIMNLNQQLRQYQMEQRKERQMKSSSMDDMLGGSQGAAKSKMKGSGLSAASMKAMISADVSMKQANVQGSMAVQMKGKEGVLEAEIKTDRSRGGNTEQKEQELADLKIKEKEAYAAQISNLADANKAMEKAAKEDQAAESEKSKNGQTDQTDGKAEKTGEVLGNKPGSVNHEAAVTAETPSAEAVQTEPHPVSYTPVDIRL